MNKLFKNKKLIIILTAFIVILVIGAIFIYIAITKDLFNNTKTSISQSEVSQVENIKEADKENEIIDNNTEEVSNNIQEQIENQQENTENNKSQNSQPEAETTAQEIKQDNQSMTQTKETKAVNQNTKVVETKTTTKSTKAQEETPKTTQSNSQTQTQTQTTPVTQETKQTETQVTQPTTPKQEEPKQIQCSGNNHLIGTGNTGRWFNTRQEAINYYNSTYANWSKKWENFEIDDDTFNKNCPNRYEIYQCICGKWTIDFFYEY